MEPKPSSQGGGAAGQARSRRLLAVLDHELLEARVHKQSPRATARAARAARAAHQRRRVGLQRRRRRPQPQHAGLDGRGLRGEGQVSAERALQPQPHPGARRLVAHPRPAHHEERAREGIAARRLLALERLAA